MTPKSSIFDKTYRDYISQVAAMDLKSVGEKLGVQVKGSDVIIHLFGRPHTVSERGIIDPSGKRPSYDICVVLCKYLLLCPDIRPKENEWVSYRDFKDSGPLTSYFANEVERSIAKNFSGNIHALKEASKTLGGYRPEIEISYGVAMQFDLLPRVPVLMLFNDADEEFPAKCSVLFERRAENYLDAECLAIIGNILATSLKQATDLAGSF
jgi:hypothetical protein